MSNVSQYYGSKGGSVKDYQRLLNSMGASLNVDGIWGDKTEDAYNRLLSRASSNTGVYSLNSSPAASPASAPLNLRYESYTPMSDEALKRLAEQSGRESYELELSQLQSKHDRDKRQLETEKSRVERDYGDKARAIESAFARKRDDLSDYSLSRGMGRSSYALDMRERAFEDERSEALSALEEKQRRIEDLDTDIMTLGAVLAEGKDKLSRERLDAVTAMVDKLKYEQEKERREAERYNNTLAMQLEELRMKQRESNADIAARNAELALRQAQASYKSPAKKSSGSSSSKSAVNNFEKGVINEWGKLTSSGKLRYFNDNSSLIRITSYPLYQDLKRQYDELKKHYTASLNTDHGYYKNSPPRKSYSGGR